MNKTIKKYQQNPDIVGFCFNQVSNKHPNLFDKIKSSDVVKKINLYSNRPGQITKSGWHTKILNVRKDTLSDWAFTTASIYNSKNIKNKLFNTSFGTHKSESPETNTNFLLILGKIIFTKNFNKSEHTYTDIPSNIFSNINNK